MNGLPAPQGLYDPQFEHDACGLGFVASIKGHKSHDIVTKGIEVLVNLTHRGACGCDPDTGDGAGLIIQIPHTFFARECPTLGFSLPNPGEYGVGMIFFPVERQPRLQCEGILERVVVEEGLTLLGWRDTPCDGSALGRIARGSQPYIQQIFVGRAPGMDEDAFERKLYVVRKRVETEIADSDIESQGNVLHSARSPPAPSSTRDCCSPRRSQNSTTSFPIPTSPALSAWFTSAFRPTRFRPGSWRIPSATSRTTAKSTPLKATSTGCTRASRCWNRRSSARI